VSIVPPSSNVAVVFRLVDSIGKSREWQETENSSHDVWSGPVERGGNVNWRDKVESRFGLGFLTPAAFAASRLTATSPSNVALRRKARSICKFLIGAKKEN